MEQSLRSRRNLVRVNGGNAPKAAIPELIANPFQTDAEVAGRSPQRNRLSATRQNPATDSAPSETSTSGL